MNLQGSLPPCVLEAPGTLSSIHLASNNLSGTIPDVIPANTSLLALELSSNNLTGPLPASLANALSLHNLDLHANQLSGSIPENLGAGITLLDEVSLSQNNLTGKQPTPGFARVLQQAAKGQ